MLCLYNRKATLDRISNKQSKKSDILCLNMPTSLPSAPHPQISPKGTGLTRREVIVTVIAEPRFLFGSCRVPDTIIKTDHLIRVHYPPLRVGVTGLQTANKMQDLDRVSAKVITGSETLDLRRIARNDVTNRGSLGSLRIRSVCSAARASMPSSSQDQAAILREGRARPPRRVRQTPDLLPSSKRGKHPVRSGLYLWLGDEIRRSPARAALRNRPSPHNARGRSMGPTTTRSSSSGLEGGRSGSAREVAWYVCPCDQPSIQRGSRKAALQPAPIRLVPNLYLNPEAL